jgi:DNA-binding winged helix-turn-helix (wHTH) protein
LRYLFEILHSIRTGASYIVERKWSLSHPRVFDLLDYLIRNRERVVSKDDLISAVWNGRASRMRR